MRWFEIKENKGRSDLVLIQVTRREKKPQTNSVGATKFYDIVQKDVMTQSVCKVMHLFSP